MADKLKFCHICYQKHVSKPSTVWCSECEQVFCTECEAYHSSIQSSKGHVTTSIETYIALDESIRQIHTHCSSHDEKYQMFCTTHDVPLCHSCLEEHSSCKEVSPLKKLVKNIKLSQTANDIDESLTDLEKNVSKIKGYLEKNQETLDQKKKDILSDISQTRMIINKHLDKLEKRLTEKVNVLNAKSKNQLDSLLQSLNNINAKALSYRNQVDILKKQCSDLQTFLALRHISLNIDSSENDLKTMMDKCSFDQLSLECDMNDRLTCLSRDVEKFGQVRLQKAPCDITLDDHKERQAQHVVYQSKSLDNIKIGKVRSFETAYKNMHDCGIMPDGTILFTDDDTRCLNGTDSTGKHLFSISTLPYGASGVAVIDDKTVAVTSAGGGCAIHIVDIGSRTIKRCIHVDCYCCYGVVHRGGKLLVCARGDGILSINLTTEEITTIVQHYDLPYNTYITSYEDKLYYTDHESETVTCCDMKGNVIWTFKHIMCGPHGIDTDDKGRVYVCDYVYNTVTVLSGDGEQWNRIIFEKDGLENPMSLHFDKKKNNLLVSNSKTTAFLFHVSS